MESTIGSTMESAMKSTMEIISNSLAIAKELLEARESNIIIRILLIMVWVVGTAYMIYYVFSVFVITLVFTGVIRVH